MKDIRLNVAIIDDDEIALATIKSFVQSYFRQKRVMTEIQSYTSGELFLQSPVVHDLVLCDILLPGEDGIETIKDYLKENPETPVIFVSNREDKVFDSMKVHPLSYVRKDHFFEDITNALSYFLEKRSENHPDHVIVVKYGGASRRLPISSILYIEAKQHNQIVHLDSGETLLVKEKMKDFAKNLEKYGFIFCHKSFLVNCLFIRGIENNTVVLTNDEVIYVSKRKIADVKKAFLRWNMEEDG